MRDFINRNFTVEGPREFLLNVFMWSYLDVDSDAAFEQRINAAVDNNETLTAHLHGQRPFTVTGVPTNWTATSAAGGPARYTITMHRMPIMTYEFDVMQVDAPRQRATPTLPPCDHDECRATCKRATCSECGPHGGKGRVLLLESWVDCLTCKAVGS